MQALLGASNALAFDLTAACSGFVVGLVTGAQLIRARGYRSVLVVGADALSRYVDWRDRGAHFLCLVQASMRIGRIACSCAGGGAVEPTIYYLLKQRLTVGSTRHTTVSAYRPGRTLLCLVGPLASCLRLLCWEGAGSWLNGSCDDSAVQPGRIPSCMKYGSHDAATLLSSLACCLSPPLWECKGWSASTRAQPGLPAV